MAASNNIAQECRTPSDRMRVAVDLTPMLPGGSNGGIKVANLKFLEGLKNLQCFDFFFLTATATHDEVSSLVGPNDLVKCIHRNPGLRSGRPVRDLALGVDRGLLRTSGVRVLYCPFGVGRFFPNDLPTVVLVTDLLHRDFPASISPLHRAWRERCFRYIQALATKFQVISDFTADRLSSAYGISRDRIVRTYQPVHGRFPAADVIRRPEFIYPANYWIHKNHENLVFAYDLYLREMGGAAWNLVLTGLRDQRQETVRSLVARLGLEHRVKFLGYIPEQQLQEVFSGASGLVFPSLYEGFGIPLIEAMHLGIPIICSREASIPEIAGDAAYYVDARDPKSLCRAMVDITRQPELCSRLIAAGRKRLSRFNYNDEIRKLASVLEDAGNLAPDRRRLTTVRKFAWRTRWDFWYYSRSLGDKLGRSRFVPQK